MKTIYFFCILLACAGCVHTTTATQEDQDFKRFEYLQTVFLPAQQACHQAGGFMILENVDRFNDRHADLSYSTMRLAVARGCGGI